MVKKWSPSYIKAFNVTQHPLGIKMYDLTTEIQNSGRALFFWKIQMEKRSITVLFTTKREVSRNLKWDLDFSMFLIKRQASKGNIVTKYAGAEAELE